MIPTIAFVVGAALGVAVGWSLGFDLGWQSGAAEMVQKSRALAAAEAAKATAEAGRTRAVQELIAAQEQLEAIRQRNHERGVKAAQTRKANEALAREMRILFGDPTATDAPIETLVVGDLPHETATVVHVPETYVDDEATIDPRETLRADLLAEATHGGADGR